MSLDEVLSKIEKFGSDIVEVTLIDKTIFKCILQDAFSGHPSDVRGYKEPYVFLIMVDKPEIPTEVFKCSLIETIEFNHK